MERVLTSNTQQPPSSISNNDPDRLKQRPSFQDESNGRTAEPVFEKLEKPSTDRTPSRIDHFTWAWYCLTMATGGIALLLSPENQPYDFRGLMTIGTIVYIFNLVLFVGITAAIAVRFVRDYGALSKSLRHPTESLFFPTFWLSIATILSGMQIYGGPSAGYWLVVTMRVLFWIYVAFTFLVSVFQYWSLFRAKIHTINNMTPSWILPVFPIMLTGTIASVTAPHQPKAHSIPIIVGGVSFQGLGMTVSILMYANWVRRLMQYGLPEPNVRPGMFIAVGPPSFTALALIGIARAVPHDMGYFGDPAIAREALNVIATFNAILLWSVSLWFFAISLLSVLAGIKAMNFHLTWWAMVFPNVGFTIATIKIGEAFQSAGVKWVGSMMTILLIIMYIFVFVHHVKAVIQKKIMSEGKDEDA